MGVGRGASGLLTLSVGTLCCIALVNHGYLSTPRESPLPPYNVYSATHPPMCNVNPKDNKKRVKATVESGNIYKINNFAYPCKKYNPPNSRNKDWPMVLKPSRGSLLDDIDINKFDDKVKPLIKSQLEVQKERTAHLADACAANPKQTRRERTHIYWGLRWDPPIVYCPIFKAASTTWLTNFLHLAHVNENNTIINSLTNVTEEEREVLRYAAENGGGHRRVGIEFPPPSTVAKKRKMFKKAIKFIVVRHPFNRLLSAYRDKIEMYEAQPFRPYFQAIGQYIIYKYRPKNAYITQNTPTFSEFVDYVIDTTHSYTTRKEWDDEVVCWAPFWVQCSPCINDFQVILKLETMHEDEQFLAHIANLKEIQNVHEWRNSKRKPSSVVVPDYFTNLTKEQVQKLYECYKLDFDLFDYDIKDYLKYAKD